MVIQSLFNRPSATRHVGHSLGSFGPSIIPFVPLRGRPAGEKGMGDEGKSGESDRQPTANLVTLGSASVYSPLTFRPFVGFSFHSFPPHVRPRSGLTTEGVRRERSVAEPEPRE